MFVIMKCCIPIFVIMFMTVHAEINKHECNVSSDAVRIAPRGGSITLGCPITLDPGIGVKRVYWRKNGSPVVNSTKYEMTNGRSLTITNLKDEDKGNYSCKILSTAAIDSTDESGNITLYVTDLSVSHCRPGDSSCLIYGGNITNLTCSSSGYPRPLRTTWEMNGESLNSSAIDLTRYTHNLTLICRALDKCFPANKRLDVYYHLLASPRKKIILLSVVIPLGIVLIGLVTMISIILCICRHRNRDGRKSPSSQPVEQELELVGRVLRDRLKAASSDSDRKKLQSNVIKLLHSFAESAPPERKSKKTRKTADSADSADTDSVMSFVLWVVHERTCIASEQRKDIFDVIISLHPDETGRYPIQDVFDHYSQSSSLHNQSSFIFHDSIASTSATASERANSCPVVTLLVNSLPDVGFNKESGEHQHGENSAPAEISSIPTKSKRGEKRKQPTNSSANFAESLKNAISYIMKELEDMTEAKKADIHNQIAFEILPFFKKNEDQHVTTPNYISTLKCDDGMKLLIEKIAKLNNPIVIRDVMDLMSSPNSATEETNNQTPLKNPTDMTNSENDRDDPGNSNCSNAPEKKMIDLADSANDPLINKTEKTKNQTPMKNSTDITNTGNDRFDPGNPNSSNADEKTMIDSPDYADASEPLINTIQNAIRGTTSLGPNVVVVHCASLGRVSGRQAKDSSHGKPPSSTEASQTGIVAYRPPPLIRHTNTRTPTHAQISYIREMERDETEDDTSENMENRETTEDKRDEVTPKSMVRETHKDETKADIDDKSASSRLLDYFRSWFA